MVQVAAPEPKAGEVPSPAQRLREDFARFEVSPDLGELLRSYGDDLAKLPITNGHGLGELLINDDYGLGELGVRHGREGAARAPERFSGGDPRCRGAAGGGAGV